MYENLEAKAAKGDYSYLIDPLDYLILETLPDEGTMFGGVYPEGRTSGNVAKEKFDGILEASQVATRLTMMRRLGLTTEVKSLTRSSQASWQRTAKGKELVTEWQQRKTEQAK